MHCAGSPLAATQGFLRRWHRPHFVSSVRLHVIEGSEARRFEQRTQRRRRRRAGIPLVRSATRVGTTTDGGGLGLFLEFQLLIAPRFIVLSVVFIPLLRDKSFEPESFCEIPRIVLASSLPALVACSSRGLLNWRPWFEICRPCISLCISVAFLTM
jgi:hypothetical protein